MGTQSEPIDLSKVPVGNSPFFSIDDGAGASTYAGNPMNTANCYVVTRPGWYKIPVVYGNAIKGTASEKERPNTAAYKPSGSGNNFLTDFIRHDGNTITKPWIKDNGINLDNGIAEPVWQDWPLLVQNIGFNRSNKDYIVFHVSKDNIHEGNAVIALKDNNGTIVWSWHIWVYGGNNLKTIRVRNNIGMSGGRPGQDNFNFLSENLGSCYDSGESVTFPAGNVWVKVSNDRKTAVIKISRNTGPSSFTTSPKYNNTYYQWGRKDPILPSDGTVANKNKVWFDWSGAMKTSEFSKHFWQTDGSASEANSEIANTIKYPMVPNKSSKMDNLYCNLWDSSCKEFCRFGVKKARFLPVTKSVYDPCPPGFCLPPNGSFTGFTRSGSTTWKLSEFNVSGSFDNGWHCRTVLKGESGGTTIFFPASGYLFINYEGVELGAAYWSGTPYDKGDGDILLFSSSHMVPGMEGAYRGCGYAVRPVAEN